MTEPKPSPEASKGLSRASGAATKSARDAYDGARKGADSGVELGRKDPEQSGDAKPKDNIKAD
ncbi:hypothetical protein BH09PSE2_BH09PSE2_04700 [soil metagenome]